MVSSGEGGLAVAPPRDWENWVRFFILVRRGYGWGSYGGASPRTRRKGSARPETEKRLSYPAVCCKLVIVKNIAAPAICHHSLIDVESVSYNMQIARWRLSDLGSPTFVSAGKPFATTNQLCEIRNLYQSFSFDCCI